MRHARSDHNCSACTWPYSPEGWAFTTRKVRRITLDTGCVNAKRSDEHLNLIEAWQAQGLIELQRSKVFLEELKGWRVEKGASIRAHPPPWWFGPLGGGPEVLYARMPKRELLREIIEFCRNNGTLMSILVATLRPFDLLA